MTTPIKAVPRSRLARITRLAGLGMRAGVAKVTAKDLGSALHDVSETLGTLRGLATKVGQMASYVDGLVPNADSELYGQIMGRLCTATAQSSGASIRSIVEGDLGSSIGELFLEWEDEPIASASLGQVHKARLHDGTAVAVKVQHPGVAEAMESDLKNISVLESFLRPLAGQKIDTKSVVGVLCQRFREELDYELEANRQRWFADLHRHDAAIEVPKVFADRSSRRVLTSGFVEGRSLEQVAQDNEELRRAYAETLWRFVFRGSFVGGAFNTDPHPGNYIFQDAGRVSFIDFGSIQPLTDHMSEFGLAQYLAACAGDEQAFDRATASFYRTNQAPLIVHTRHCFAPLFSSPFRITREYARGLLEESTAMAKQIKGKSEAPPELPLFNRLQFGFYSVLARLDVTVDYAAVCRGVLSEMTTPRPSFAQRPPLAAPGSA